jgi:microcystin-dependent protein
MPLESATYISDLNTANPAHTDDLSEADSHMRLTKAVLKTTFPNVTGAVTGTHTQLNTAAAGFPIATASISDSAVTTAKIADSNVTTAKIADAAVTTAKLVSAALLANYIIPAGVVWSYAPAAGGVPPTGWLFCDGSAVSRATYPSLFTSLSTLYGVGDGSTTFNLPDYRGRVLAAKDNMGGITAGRLTGLSGGVDGLTIGAVGGLETHTLTEAQLPIVSMAVPAQQPTFTFSYRSIIDGGSGDDVAYQIQGSGLAEPVTTTGDASPGSVGFGSGSAHNNVQPTAIVTFIIKAH